MNSANYYDWSQISGLYVRNVSPTDRYRTFQPLVSPAGLTVIVVAEFLRDISPEMDVTRWRTHSVYEMSPEADERVALTAESLDAIGATQMAAAVRSAKSVSPFDMLQQAMQEGNGSVEDMMQVMRGVKGVDLLNHIHDNIAANLPELAAEMGITPAGKPSSKAGAVGPPAESQERLEHLLELFVESHQSELQADLDQHGDPRTTPGYTREVRMQEIDEIRRRLYAEEGQVEKVGQLRKLLNQYEKMVAAGDLSSKKATTKLNQYRRELKETLREVKLIDTEQHSPAMQEVLQQIDTFQQSHPVLFAPPKQADEQTAARLQALGEYDVETDYDVKTYSWDDPTGFEDKWKFSLSLTHPKKSAKSLPALLNAVDYLRANLSRLAQDWHAEILHRFRDVYFAQMQDWELEDYELDENGEPTDDSILAQVEEPQIHLEYQDDESISGEVSFSAEFDCEHGLQIEFEVESSSPEVTEASPPPSMTFDLESLGLTDSGPAITSTDIDRLETRFQTKLPEEYRSFLLTANGGRPRRSWLKFGPAGAKMDADFLRFYSVSNADTEPYPDGSLEAALQKHQSEGYPATVLPIGEVRTAFDEAMAGGMGSGIATVYVLTQGKKAGGLVTLSIPMLDSVPAAQRALMLQSMLSNLTHCSLPVAKSLTDLVATRLTEPKPIAIPDWLRAIREDDVNWISSWITKPANRKATFQERGRHMPLSVIDYLALEASPAILKAVFIEGRQRTDTLFQSWQNTCCGRLDRFHVLKPFLSADQWKEVLNSPDVWNHLDVLEGLAAEGLDFNDPVDDDRQTPISLATQCGSVAGVKWLMQHGADPHKYDQYQRNAFTWTHHSPGFDCLRTLQGKDELAPSRPAQPDDPGIQALKQAADDLPPGVSLVVKLQMKSPPVSEQEKRLYHECHFVLSLDIHRESITINDVHTPRQTYLSASPWPALLFAPITQWPELTMLWDHLAVEEFDWNKALKQRKYQPKPRPDLLSAATSAMQQALNPEEADARQIRVTM